jgi:hypothetical protein
MRKAQGDSKKFHLMEVDMKLRKIAIAACSAGVLLAASAPASAAAFLIGGKWYFFSLDFEASLAKVSGKDLRDGTRVFAEVKIDESNIQCANPQGNLVDPGEGPKSTASGTSANVTDKNLTRSANKVTGNIYTTTAAVALPKDPPLANPCKDPNGVAEWKPTYWQFAGCVRGTATNPIPVGTVGSPVCYTDRAFKRTDGTLVYVSGPLTGTPVAAPADWTFVYLPTEFRYKAAVETATVETSSEYGACNFPANNEPGAPAAGLPYSLDNPPTNGWAAYPPVSYVCTAIPLSTYSLP